jgi:hypothetical protein
MEQKRYSEEQIIEALKQVGIGRKVCECVCYLEGKLKQRVAGLTLDNHSRASVVKKASDARRSAINGHAGRFRSSGRHRVIDHMEDLHEPSLDRKAASFFSSRGKPLLIHEDDLNDSFPWNEVLVVHCCRVLAEYEKVWTGSLQDCISLTHGRLRFGWRTVATEWNLQGCGSIVNLDGAILLVVQSVGRFASLNRQHFLLDNLFPNRFVLTGTLIYHEFISSSDQGQRLQRCIQSFLPAQGAKINGRLFARESLCAHGR